MIIVNRKKKNEKFQSTVMPSFENARLAMRWLKNQQMKEALINVKSISVQIKDIRQMAYSQNPKLVLLYSVVSLDENFSDDDYINISKYKKGNMPILYSLLNCNWLLNYDELKDKTIEELEGELYLLQNNIIELQERVKNTKYPHDISKKIKLLEYKLACLSDYINEKNNDILSNQTEKNGKCLVKI